MTDEGLAIWKSLDVKNPKPNILFNISLFVIITYNLDKMNFAELFTLIRDTYKIDDQTAYSKVARCKRYCADTSVLFGDAYEHEYLAGYLDVEKMNDQQRDDILKYNIGLRQLKELPKIKKFLDVNGFGD